MIQMFVFRRQVSSGGAEIASERLVKQLAAIVPEVRLIHSGSEWNGFVVKDGVGPGWVKLLIFAFYSNRLISSFEKEITLSMERGLKADMYRAGEGVHLAWMKRKGFLKSCLSFRLLHPVSIFLERISLAHAKFIVANSELVADEIRHYYPKYRDKVRLIENGYNPDRYYPVPVVGDDRVMCFVGNGWERKGLDVAIQIFSRLSQKWKLKVLGKGDQSRYIKLAAQLGCRDRIEFVGVVKDVEKYFAGARVLILPTKYDPFSNACLEAAACGCPVITTMSNGFCRLIDHGVNGYILDNGDQGDCAGWVESEQYADRESVAAFVREHTIAHETEKYRKLIEFLANPVSKN